VETEAGYEFKKLFFSKCFFLGMYVLADTYISKFEINSVQIFTVVSRTVNCSVNITDFEEWIEDPEVHG